jgi:hypothetical protein
LSTEIVLFNSLYSFVTFSVLSSTILLAATVFVAFTVSDTPCQIPERKSPKVLIPPKKSEIPLISVGMVTDNVNVN